MNLIFEVKNQYIRRIDSNYVVAGTRNYLCADFIFSSEWNGVTALFTRDGKSYAQAVANGECIIPWEVVASEGEFEVSVFCGDLITANSVRVNVNKTGYDEYAVESLTPTPSVWEQYKSYIEDLVNEAKTMAHTHAIADVSGLASDLKSKKECIDDLYIYCEALDTDVVKLKGAVSDLEEKATLNCNGVNLWTGTQSQFDDITSKDNDTLYMIVG